MRDVSFTISWTTTVLSTGYVRWGIDNGLAPNTVAHDKRGVTTSSTVHYVTVSNLQPSTRYLFDVVSGDTIDTNFGAHYVVTTGPTLDASSPKLISGTLSLRDGGTPTGALVQLVATGPSGTSAPITTVVSTSDQKAWLLNLGNLRTADLSTPYPYTDATVLSITADSGPDGTATGSITVAASASTNIALSLADEVRLSLYAGWNLIAIQAVPSPSLTASSFCTALNASVAGTVVELDRWIDGGWESHRCSVPANDFAIEVGPGYFARLTAPTTWAYRGSLVTTATPRTLAAGWNLVGVAVAAASPPTAATVCDTLNTAGGSGTVVELDRWEAGGWDGHRCGLPPNDFTLQLGQAVFVRLTRSTTWSPTGSAPMSASSLRRVVPTPTPQR